MAFGSISVDRIVDSEGSVFSPSSVSFRNRIINGDMRIDQRNAGASITPTATTYSVDRWQATVNVASKASFDQTTTAPSGLTNSMLITSLSAYSVAAGDIVTYRQQIEGFNIADLGWGTASAKTVTVSFWVRSSLTGTFGGSIKNGDSTRSYPFTYSISVADTWEYKTITVAGDTSGTWATDNTSGLILSFGIGVGSTTSGTAGAWAGTNYNSATGATSLLATNGATFYITGVQLEVGSVATPFERRPFGTELSLCQRYFQTFTKPVLRGVASGGSSLNRLAMPTLVTMRAAPTLVISGTLDWYDGGGGVGTLTTQSSSYSTISSIEIDATAATGTTASTRPIVTYIGGNTGTITASAEL